MSLSPEGCVDDGGNLGHVDPGAPLSRQPPNLQGQPLRIPVACRPSRVCRIQVMNLIRAPPTGDSNG